MGKKKLFLYPMKPHEQLAAKNPYLFNLANSLKEHYTILNYGRPQSKSFGDIFKYFFKADVFYFNWIENTSSRLSYILLSVVISAAKLLGKKVVWTHHNVHPHNSDNIMGMKLIQLFTKESNYIITHTKLSPGLLGLSKTDPKIIYFFHPFFSKPVKKEAILNKVYDLLIWGNMRRSKGIDEFMNYLLSNSLLDRYSIKIIGKFDSEEYFKEFKSLYEGKRVQIENRYADNDELKILHAKSKFVFFPYTGSSVLNSGALITSLPYGTPIIGPKNGSFTEIGDAGLIKLYNEFSDVISYVDNYSDKDLAVEKAVDNFCEKNTWSAFSKYISDKIN